VIQFLIRSSIQHFVRCSEEEQTVMTARVVLP
jgi:hypothetical protein